MPLTVSRGTIAPNDAQLWELMKQLRALDRANRCSFEPVVTGVRVTPRQWSALCRHLGAGEIGFLELKVFNVWVYPEVRA